MPVISGFFADAVVGPLRPPAQILQWDRDQVDPSGYRHWESGEYRPVAKVSLVGGFDAQMESGRALDFGEAVVVDAGFLTDTIVFTFNMGEVNTHPDSFFDKMVAASSVNTKFKAFNMKFWVGNLAAFTASGMPPPIFYMRTSAEWRQGYSVVPGDPFVIPAPSSMPLSGNILASSPPTVFVSGSYKDLEFSHFVYLRGQFPSGDYQLGTYGGLGEETFTFNFSYDWTSLNANVLESDIVPCSPSG